VEGGGDLLPLAGAARSSCTLRTKRRSVAEEPVVGLGVDVACELLGLDRGLSLVYHLLADAEERGVALIAAGCSS
jgi:hypothetical protein